MGCVFCLPNGIFLSTFHAVEHFQCSFWTLLSTVYLDSRLATIGFCLLVLLNEVLNVQIFGKCFPDFFRQKCVFVNPYFHPLCWSLNKKTDFRILFWPV